MLRIAGLTLLVGAAFVCGTYAKAEQRPNIVVLVADDLGWAGVGYHNPQFETPHIDQLVARGIELDRFYVAPMCSPTRAGLMTGRYPIRFGLARAVIPPQRDYGLPVDETTIAEALGQLGYEQRAVFGKWHLGHLRPQWHPLQQGFTHFHGHYNGAIDYFALTREGERDWHVNWEPSLEEGYATDLIGRAASDWIGAAAAGEAPYFCYVPFNAPHSPFQAPEEAIERFAHLADQRPPGGSRRAERPSQKQILAAMIWKMDQAIGQVLAAIASSGEAENTLVWFFSDNGGVASIPDSNRPLRGSKLTVYEGGIRVPACVCWPAGVPAGGRSETVMGYIDVFPTLLSAAGGEASQLSQRPLDGVDVLPVLTGRPLGDQLATALERPWFSYHGQSGPDSEHLAVTLDGWKLKVNGPQLKQVEQLGSPGCRVELFHLAEDPMETDNLAGMRPEKVRELATLLVEHRALQPEHGVPPYSAGRRGFVAPRQWRLSPQGTSASRP